MIKTYFYDHEEHSMRHDVDLSESADLLLNPNNLLWIDLYDCSESELNYIGDIFNFHPLALEDCFQESPRAKIDRYDDYHFFVFHALRYFEEAEEEDEISSIELDVFLGPQLYCYDSSDCPFRGWQGGSDLSAIYGIDGPGFGIPFI